MIIRTPSPVELEAEQTTAEGLLSFLISYFEDIFWERIEFGERMKRLISDEFKRQGLDPEKDSKETIVKAVDRAVSMGDSNLHK